VAWRAGQRVAPKIRTAPRHTNELLFLALFVTAAVRLYLLWQYYCISSDGLGYINAAKDFYAGNIKGGLSSVYPPAYPVLIAALFPSIGDWELAGQILSVLCGVFLIFPLYLLFRDAFDERVALVACFLAAVNPFLARYGVHVRTESIFLFLSALALLFFYQGIEKERRGRFFLGGLVTGFAYLVRPEAMGLLFIVPAVVLVRWLSKKQPSLLSAGQTIGALFLGFFLFALPYIVYLSIDTGRWGAVSRKVGVTLGVSLRESGILDASDADETASAESDDFVQFVRHHPLLYVKKISMDLLPAIGVFFAALHYSYVPFLLVGLMFVFREKFWQRKDFLFLGFITFYIFGMTLVYVKRRYSLQVVPISLGWTAVGILWSWNYLRQSFPPRVSKALLLILCSVFLVGTLPITLTPISREKAYVRDAGWYLRKHDPSGKLRVALFDDRVAFYGGVTPVQVFAVEESRLQKYLHDQRADYLAAESKAWQKIFPSIAGEPKRYGLVLEREFIGSRNDRMLLFKVV
jgi:4-amino-4-deoxy-L-arabinose transferase-like glycosyltransferase